MARTALPGAQAGRVPARRLPAVDERTGRGPAADRRRSTRSALPGQRALQPLTVGVEEEFLLLDAQARPAPAAVAVVEALPARLSQFSRFEYDRCQVELVTPVCDDLDTLSDALTEHRWAAAQAAGMAGARLVAVPVPPAAGRLEVADVPRYREVARHFAGIGETSGTCGCHVHVGVPSRDAAVEVSNRLRPWLPVVQALTVNSPLYRGCDTGYASWRSVGFGRRPSAGPTPYFRSVAHHDSTVARLVRAGALLDEQTVYWYARPSSRYPTVEVRVSDVCATVAETVLVAALTRALVATALREAAAGVPAPRVSQSVLAAAHWRAARDGLDGMLVDLPDATLRPAWDVLRGLLRTVRPALLRHNDVDRVRSELARLRANGTGARRQRKVYRRSGDSRAVADYLATETLAV
jgi:carboxylate-amine ligase